MSLTGVFAALVFVTRAFCMDSLGNVSLWPPNGALVVALLVLPRRMSGPVMLACLAINLVANQVAGYPLNQNLLYSTLNIAVSLTAAVLIRRYCGAATDLSRFRRFAAFSVAVVVATMVEATIGECFNGVTAGYSSVLNEWTQWVLCDSLGLLISTPAILLGIKSHRYALSFEAGTVERWILFIVTGAATFVGFSLNRSPAFLFIYPLLILTAFRAGPAWVLASVMTVAIIASALTMHGLGPMAFLAGAGLVSRQEVLQPFLVSLFLCALPPNNALGERNRTARRLERLNVQARLARVEAVSANAAKSQFIANISHEIRTPLNGVLGMAQAMGADELTPVQRDRLQVVRQSGEGLLAILNDILDVAKIEAGKLELEAIAFDLGEVVGGVHSAFTALAAEKGLSFSLDIEASACALYRGDPTRLRQILYNLISNAMKFTERGEIRVAVVYEDGKVRLSVADTGIGIPEVDQRKLFERFAQADASTTRRFGGTGLGLAICSQLVQLMGGDITVHSAEGTGSTFAVHLPMEQVGPALAPAIEAIEPVGVESVGADLRVLAAEDNSVNQLVLKTLLGQIGVEPVIVGDGLAAVEAWSSQDWDVILMDIQMPVMDGLTATRLIRQRERAEGRPRTPIVALTANAMAHQVAEYQAIGMDGHVSKPIDVRALFEALEAVIISSNETMPTLAQLSPSPRVA